MSVYKHEVFTLGVTDKIWLVTQNRIFITWPLLSYLDCTENPGVPFANTQVYNKDNPSW